VQSELIHSALFTSQKWTLTAKLVQDVLLKLCFYSIFDGFHVWKTLINTLTKHNFFFFVVSSKYNCCRVDKHRLRWCLAMLLRLRLIKKQYYTCLVNYKPQVNLAWVPLETAFQIQKMKSNYLLLFMRFCSLSSPTISNCFPTVLSQTLINLQ